MTTQPAGEQHTGNLNLTGQGNPDTPASPISDAIAQTAYNAHLEVTLRSWHVWYGHRLDPMRAALEAAYPAIRQHVAEQIAAALDRTADSLKRSADDDRQRSIDAGGRATYDGDRLMRLAINRNNRAGGFRDAAYLTREIGAGRA